MSSCSLFWKYIPMAIKATLKLFVIVVSNPAITCIIPFPSINLYNPGHNYHLTKSVCINYYYLCIGNRLGHLVWWNICNPNQNICWCRYLLKWVESPIVNMHSILFINKVKKNLLTDRNHEKTNHRSPRSSSTLRNPARRVSKCASKACEQCWQYITNYHEERFTGTQSNTEKLKHTHSLPHSVSVEASCREWETQWQNDGWKLAREGCAPPPSPPPPTLWPAIWPPVLVFLEAGGGGGGVDFSVRIQRQSLGGTRLITNCQVKHSTVTIPPQKPFFVNQPTRTKSNLQIFRWLGLIFGRPKFA